MTMKRAVRSPNRILLYALLLCTLIGTLSACASDENEYVRSSSAVPDGWEIVSESEGVTHIRMKEGSDAYYWIENTQNSGFYIDLSFPGNENRGSMRPDSEGNINLLVYFGYDNVKRMDTWGDPLEPTDLDSFQLVFDDLAMYRAYKVLYEFDVEAVTTSSNVAYDDTQGVGLTEAVIYSIPISEMAARFDEMTLLIRFDYRDDDGYMPEIYPTSQATYERIELEYYRMNEMIHFDRAYEEEIRQTFPYSMYERYGLVHTVLTWIAIALIILCTVFRWNRFIPWIPCVAGMVFSYHANHYFEGLPTETAWAFDGLEYMGQSLDNFFAVFGFGALAVLAPVIRFVVDFIRRKKAKPTESEPVTDSETNE